MATRLTANEWEAEFGRHLRDLRLRQNIDQRQLAERADVALNAVKRLRQEKVRRSLLSSRCCGPWGVRSGWVRWPRRSR